RRTAPTRESPPRDRRRLPRSRRVVRRARARPGGLAHRPPAWRGGRGAGGGLSAARAEGGRAPPRPTPLSGPSRGTTAPRPLPGAARRWAPHAPRLFARRAGPAAVESPPGWWLWPASCPKTPRPPPRRWPATPMRLRTSSTRSWAPPEAIGFLVLIFRIG